MTRPSSSAFTFAASCPASPAHFAHSSSPSSQASSDRAITAASLPPPARTLRTASRRSSCTSPHDSMISIAFRTIA